MVLKLPSQRNCIEGLTPQIFGIRFNTGQNNVWNGPTAAPHSKQLFAKLTGIKQKSSMPILCQQEFSVWGVING